MERATYTKTVKVIIPCGGAKRDEAAPVADLYTGSMFALALGTARDMVADEDILVLSAKHGLVALDEVLAPYDVKMGQAGSISPEAVAVQAIAHGLEDADVYTMLPKAYYRVADEALKMIAVYAQDVYEGNAGIGEMRGINSSVRRSYAVVA